MADARTRRRAAPAPRTQPLAALLRDLVPMRPQGALELLDRATVVARSRTRDLGLISLAVNVPVWLVMAVALRDQWAEGLDSNAQWFWSGLIPEPFFLVQVAADALEGGWAALLIGRGLPSIALAVAGAAAGDLVAHWSAGQERSGGEALRAVGRRAPSLLALWAIIHAIEIVTVIGLVIGPVFFGIAAPLWAMEGTGPLVALRRSFQLSRRRFVTVATTIVVTWFVTSVMATVLSIGPLILLGAFTAGWIDLGGAAAVAMAGALPQLVVVPVTAVAMALLALDLRIRVEAADLRTELADLPEDRA